VAPGRLSILRGDVTPMLIGREHERGLLNELTQRRKNILILGAEGVGKTAIVDHALGAGQIKNVLHSKSSTTLKETLVNMIQSSQASKEICYQLLDQSWSMWFLITSHGLSHDFMVS
jgi:ATP-dependent Clp protease ATP-binding subunit ClpA